ncbi:MAG: purine/pyrimidine permease [Thermodesulfobacteriota bacterium]|nr:purine/pyrimidine permease [Thermodesulfobacteriota bacterium]
MSLRYSLDEKLSPLPLALFGLQWLAVALPSLIIIGQVVATVHFPEFSEQILYLRKLSFVVGTTMLVQIVWGHRLPLVMGPASVLLVGVLASSGSSLSAIYTSIMVGGAALALVSALGMFRALQRLFTARVVAVVLLLIAFTLAPAIRDLILDIPRSGSPFGRLVFAMVLVLVLFELQQKMTPLWRSTLVVGGLVVGSLVYPLFFPHAGLSGQPSLPLFSGFWQDLTWPPSFEPGLILAFLVCYLALAVNDLGSIQSLDGMLRPGNMAGRMRKGMTITGLSGCLAGFLGVLGPVNFSLSPGVIAASGCAARRALWPAAVVMIGLAFLPGTLSVVRAVPPTVVGAILLFILSAQVAAGLMSLYSQKETVQFEHGLVVGLPVLAGTIISFMPSSVAETLPGLTRPIAGNGFVAGVLLALWLEHVVFRRKTAQ